MSNLNQFVDSVTATVILFVIICCIWTELLNVLNYVVFVGLLMVYRYAPVEVEIRCIYLLGSDEFLSTSDHCASDYIPPLGCYNW